MKDFPSSDDYKSIHSSNSPCTNQVAILRRSFRSFLRFLLFQAKPFWIQLFYFVIMSLVGYLALILSPPKTTSVTPQRFDLFFTSVSATTVSSMSTLEMEVFSNTQLIFLTILMFLGGEVFTSMLGLQFKRFKFPKPQKNETLSEIELGFATNSKLENEKTQNSNAHFLHDDDDGTNLKYNSIKYLGYVVLCYLLVVHFLGSSLVSLYTSLVPSAKHVLKTKNLKISTFSLFTTVSTFANCGFVPTNENMIVFKKNSGLLLLLITQILIGNTFYPVCLRLLLRVLRIITKRVEPSYLLENSQEIGYSHLLSSNLHVLFLASTAFGFIVLQFTFFCAMEWNNEAMTGLNSYQKLVASLFQVTNSRHTGESVFDLSIMSQAILVVFVVMMYLPPYTSLLPIEDKKGDSRHCKESDEKSRKTFLECLIFSQLSYLAIFIVGICITEREKIRNDPLNFNVLNITVEVISAYGNVGFSTGYSCTRQIRPESSCKDTWSGFVGRWSSMGKCILILVMFFGRLKKFSMQGGKAWKLS